MYDFVAYVKDVRIIILQGVWGTDVEKEGEEMARQRKFRKVTIPEMRARLKVCACAYQVCTSAV